MADYYHNAGKGSRPRPQDLDRYAENYERIFGSKKKSQPEPKQPQKEQDHANTQG